MLAGEFALWCRYSETKAAQSPENRPTNSSWSSRGTPLALSRLSSRLSASLIVTRLLRLRSGPISVIILIQQATTLFVNLQMEISNTCSSKSWSLCSEFLLSTLLELGIPFNPFDGVFCC